MRFEVILIHELDRVRGHHRQFKFHRQIEMALYRRLAFRFAGALQFQIEGAGKSTLPPLRQQARLLVIAVEQGHADFAHMRAGQTDQAAVIATVEPFFADFRFAAALVFKEGARQ